MTRLGVIVPSSNTVVEPDFARWMPDGVTLLTARMHLAQTTPEAERVMLDQHAPQAALDLGTARPEAVVFACTSAGALLGEDGEADLQRRLGELSGAPVVSTNRAVADALRRAGAHRVAVVTPYVQALTDAIATVLRTRGFEVPVAAGMGISENFQISQTGTDEIVAFASGAVKQHRDAFDTLFVSCTNLPALTALPRLAETFATPVVTSNQATIEAALAQLGLPAPDWGRG